MGLLFRSLGGRGVVGGKYGGCRRLARRVVEGRGKCESWRVFLGYYWDLVMD